MIPTLTHHALYTYFKARTPSQVIFDPEFETLSFSEKLQSIGMFDSRFNLLFTPSEIPPIKDMTRWKELMAREVFPGMNHSEYISGFVPVLAEKGIAVQSYLRGGYAAYVVCMPDYLEFLIHAFLVEKGLPIDLFAKELEAMKLLDCSKEPPHDADLFDQVLTKATTKFDLHNHHLEFLPRGTKFKQKLIPTVSPLFPYEEEYVLFTIGDDKFQTDRIIGWLSHEYLFSRDDIRIKYGETIPESAGNFWQMVTDRSLKIVRTEPWHEKDFRAGLAALQLMEEEHILLEEGCTLGSIINYALSTRSDKIFTGAVDRAKLHCKKPYGFLLSVLIAYLHADNFADLQILKDAIGEIPDLPSLYQFALLLTLYDDTTGTYQAEWDPSGFLILHVDDNRIIFPKNFAAANANPLPHMKLRLKANPHVHPELYSQNYLTRVLIEIALHKPFTSSDALYDALIDYLIHTDNPEPIVPFLPKEFLYANKVKNGWIKALLKCSYKHGIKLWNITKDENTLSEIIHQMAMERPNNCYVLLDEVSKELRFALLKKS